MCSSVAVRALCMGHKYRASWYLESGQVDQEGLVLLAGLGYHVEQQVCDLNRGGGVAAHGRHHYQLLRGRLIHNQLRCSLDALCRCNACPAKLVHLRTSIVSACVHSCLVSW